MPAAVDPGVVDEALDVLSGDFARLYAQIGRPGIAPEKLLRALLLQAFYSIRSERQLMEQLDYNLLFRWFAGRSMDAPVWDATTLARTGSACWTVTWRNVCSSPLWPSPA